MPDNNKTTVILIGATGVVGSRLIEDLISSTKVDNIISISRSPVFLSSLKLTQVIRDTLSYKVFQELDVSGDVFISALGTTINTAKSKDAFRDVDYGINLDFARFAKDCSAKEFYLISSLGANKNSPFFYNKVKGELEDIISHLGLSKVAILRPSLLISNRAEFRLFELIAIRIIQFISRFLPRFISSKLGTKPSDISRFIVHSLMTLKDNFIVVSKF